MDLFFEVLFWFLLIGTFCVLAFGGLMAINCSPGGRMRPTRIPPPPPSPKSSLIEKVETILAVKEFRIDRKSVTGHGSTLFQSFEPLRAIDVHPSGRLTVMKEDNGVNSVYGFDDLDEAIETLIS